MENRADLPALESVEASGFVQLVAAICLAVIGTLGLAGTVVAGAIFYLPGPRPRWPDILGIAVPAVLAFGVLFGRWAVRTGYRWKTDRDGLTEFSLTARKLLPWPEVTRATGSWQAGGRSAYGRGYCTVWAGRKKLGVHGLTDDASILAASIWQHLRRLGKADDNLLSDQAKSLWMPIPDSIPQDVDYYNARVPDWRLTLLGIVAVLAGCVAAWVVQPKIVARHVGDFGSHFIFVLIPRLVTMTRDRLMTARTVFVRSQWLEATTAMGKIDVQWHDIRRVQFTGSGLLLNAGGVRRSVLLPYRYGDDEQARVILVAIRRLRSSSSPMAVPIPKLILASKTFHGLADAARFGPLPEAVEVRPPVVAFVLVLVAVAMTAALCHLAFALRFSWWLRAAAFAYCAIIALYMAARLVKGAHVDAEGITLRGLFGRKRVKWSEVAAYSIAPAAAPGEFSRVLRGANGRVLLRLYLPLGSKADRERLYAFVDARLADVRRDGT